MLLLVPALGVFASGCLNDTYRVPDAEVARLVSLPPDVRTSAIRTIQRTTMATDLTTAPELPPGAPPPPNGAPPPAYGYPGYVDTGPHVFVGVGFMAPMPAPYYFSAPAGGGRVAPAVRGGAAGSTNPTRGVGGGGAGSSGAKADKDALIALAVVGAAFTIGMIATEGARFDGWTRAHPAQPLHLIYNDGNQRAIPLYLLTQNDLAGVQEAVISEADGRVDRLGRAPLDRKGFAWRFDGGAMGGSLSDGTRGLGWGVAMGLGYFPTQTFGLLLNGTVAAGTAGEMDYTNGRFGLEANWLPLSVGRLHVGAFGLGARQWGADSSATLDKVTWPSWLLGGGALVELELTTRLALLLRGGVQQEIRESGSAAPPLMMATVGFSIY